MDYRGYYCASRRFVLASPTTIGIIVGVVAAVPIMDEQVVDVGIVSHTTLPPCVIYARLAIIFGEMPRHGRCSRHILQEFQIDPTTIQSLYRAKFLLIQRSLRKPASSSIVWSKFLARIYDYSFLIEDATTATLTTLIDHLKIPRVDSKYTLHFDRYLFLD